MGRRRTERGRAEDGPEAEAAGEEAGGVGVAGAEANAMGQRGGRRRPRRGGINGGGLDLRRGEALES